MIEDEHAIIMDFGIARSTSRGAPAPRSSAVVPRLPASTGQDVTRLAATVIGEVIGTIEYMAPEQARGEHIDQRADVYAFGLIVYDMLVGRRRSEHAVSAVGELQGRLAHAPPSVRSVVHAVPEALDALITKCVEPELEKRYQSSAELVAALDLLDDNGKLKPKKRVVRLPYAIAAAAVLLTISVGVWWYQRQFIPPPTHDPVSVVIADFQYNTRDAAFDKPFGQTLKRTLEGASFITGFDRTRMRPTFGVAPPENFDEVAARQLAIKQGLGVVVAASIPGAGTGYEISAHATQPLTGKEIASFSR